MIIDHKLIFLQGQSKLLEFFKTSLFLVESLLSHLDLIFQRFENLVNARNDLINSEISYRLGGICLAKFILEFAIVFLNVFLIFTYKINFGNLSEIKKHWLSKKKITEKNFSEMLVKCAKIELSTYLSNKCLILKDFNRKTID